LTQECVVTEMLALYGLTRESNARRQYELGRKRLTLGPQAAEIHNGDYLYVIAAAAPTGVQY